MEDLTQKVFSESFEEVPVKEKLPVGTLQIDGVYYTIYNTDNLIGRDFKCDIVIQNNTVSSRHAIIEAEDPQTHLLYDVGSTNKTRIGKVVLKPNVRYSINDGDLITFGTVTSIYNISKQMPKTPEKTQPISIPETPYKMEEEVHIDFVPESPEENEKENVSQFDKSDVDLFDEHIEESVKPQIPDDIYELDTLSFDMRDFVKQINNEKNIKERTEIKLQPVSEQADVSIYDLPTQGYSEEMELPVKKCSLSDSENNIALSETHISKVQKVDKRPCEEIENKTVIAQKSFQGVPEVSEMKSMPDEIEAAIEDFRNSQNSDMFGPSNSNLTPKKDDFDQFSDSGDESMCDLRTQQFRRPPHQLSVFSSTVEDDFLEPASQPVDESTFRPSLDSEVGKIDETLSTSVQSFFAGDEEKLVNENVDKSGDSSTYFAEKTLQDSAEIQSKECFERISSNVCMEISPDNLLESSNKTDPILISPNVKTAYSKTNDDLTVREKQNISIDEDLYNAETQVPCYSEIQPKSPIVMSRVQVMNNVTYTQGFYEAETQALPSENRQRGLEESDVKVGLVDNLGEGTAAGLSQSQNILEMNSKNEEEIEQVPSSSEKITQIAMIDSTKHENIIETLKTNKNSVANTEKAASTENLSEIDATSKDLSIGCDVTDEEVIITGENCHIVISPAKISSHLADVECLEFADKTQSCSDGKLYRTDPKPISVNKLTDQNDATTLNVSEKNEMDECVSEKLHLNDSSKAAKISSHLADAGCLELADKIQSCSVGKLDQTDPTPISVYELTDQNDATTLNVSEKNQMDECVSEKLHLNDSSKAAKISSHLADAGCLELADKIQSCSVGKLDQTDPTPISVYELTDQNDATTLNVSEKNQMDECVSEKLHLNDSSKAAKISSHLADAGCLEFADKIQSCSVGKLDQTDPKPISVNELTDQNDATTLNVSEKNEMDECVSEKLHLNDSRKAAKISSHLVDAGCLKFADKIQSCSVGKLDQTDPKPISVNELTDQNDATTLNVSEKNEMDECVSEKLHLNDSRKAAKISSHLADAGCLEFADKIQSCSVGKLDQTDPKPISVNELTDQNDATTLNVSEKNEMDECVSEKLHLNDSRKAAKISSHLVDAGCLEFADKTQSYSDGKMDQKDSGNMAVNELTDLNDVTTLNVSEKNEMDNCVSEKLNLNVSRKAKSVGMKSLDNSSLQLALSSESINIDANAWVQSMSASNLDNSLYQNVALTEEPVSSTESNAIEVLNSGNNQSKESRGNDALNKVLPDEFPTEQAPVIEQKNVAIPAQSSFENKYPQITVEQDAFSDTLAQDKGSALPDYSESSKISDLIANGTSSGKSYQSEGVAQPASPDSSQTVKLANSAVKIHSTSLDSSSHQSEVPTEPAPGNFHISEAVVMVNSAENCDQIPLDDSSALYEAATQPALVNPQISVSLEQINSAGKYDLPALEDTSCQFEAATQPAPGRPHISEIFVSRNSVGECDQPPLDDSSYLHEAQTQPIPESLKIGTIGQGQLSSGNEIIVLPIKQEPLDDSSYLYEAATQPVTTESLKLGNILPVQSCQNLPQDNGDILDKEKCDQPSLNDSSCHSEAATQPVPVNFHISEVGDQINCAEKVNSTPLDDSSYLYEAPTQPAPELPELGSRLSDQAKSDNELGVIYIKEEPLNDSSFLYEAPTQPVPTYLLENDASISVPIINENDRNPSESTGNIRLLNDSSGQYEDETQPFLAAEQKNSETGLLCASKSVNNLEELPCQCETQSAQAASPEIILPSHTVSNKNIIALPTTKDSLGDSIPPQPLSSEAAKLERNIISLTNSQKELNSEINCSDHDTSHFKAPDPNDKTVTDILHSIPCEKTKNLDKELPRKPFNSCENSDSTFLNLNEIDKTGLHSPNAESTRIDDSLVSKTISTESKLPLDNFENKILSSAVKTIGSVKKFKKSFPQPNKTILTTDDLTEKSGFRLVADVPIKNQNEYEKIHNKELSDISSDKDIPDVYVQISSPSQESRKTEFDEKSSISSVDMESSGRKIENDGDADVNSKVGNDVSTEHTRNDVVLKGSKNVSDSLTDYTRTDVIVEVCAKMSEDLTNTERAEAINVSKSAPRKGRPRKATLAVKADLDEVAQVNNTDINVSSDSKKPTERLRRSNRKNSKDSDVPESKSPGSSISNENPTPKKERKGKNVSKNKEMKENLIVSENAGPSGVSTRTEVTKDGGPELKRNNRKKKAPEPKLSSVQPQVEAGDSCDSTERPKRRKKPSDPKNLGVKTVNDEATDSDASKNDYLSTGIGIGRGRSNNRPIIQSQSFPECTSTDNEEAMDSDASKNDYLSTGIGLGRGRSNNRPVIQSQSFPDCTSTDNEEAMDSDGPKNTYLATGIGLGKGRSRNRPVIQSQSLSESTTTGNDDSTPGEAPKNDYLATGIGLARGRSKNRPIIQSDAENSQKLPKTSRRITNKKQNKLSDDKIGKNETSPSRSKRHSTDTLSDSQSSQHFDDSENENLGRGKRKRVKTSFDGFYTEEELKVYKPKSESPEIMSGKVGTRKKSKENDKTCQLSGKIDSPATKKILSCDSKPSTSKAHIFIDEDTIDDDLILPAPISKRVPTKPTKSSPGSEEKKKTIQDSFSKTPSFSFSDKLDELFDIWGPADTVKLSPRAASTKGDSKKSKIMNPPSSKKSLKDKFDSGDKILNDSPKMPKTNSRKLPEESSASCSKDSELTISPKHKLINMSEDVSAVKRARTRKALYNESDTSLEGGSSKSAGLVVSSAEGLESTRGRRKTNQKSTLEKNNASSKKSKTVTNNKNGSLKDVKTPANGKSSSTRDLTSFETPSDGFDDYIISQEFSFREQPPKNSVTNDEFKHPPLVPVRRSGRSRNSGKKSDGERTESVLFSGLNDRKLSDVVNNLGGRVEESPFTCTVLVTDKVRRTSKFLSVLSRGVPIVTPDWLSDSSSAAKFSDFDSYIVSDNDAEEQFGFNLKESLRQARSKKLLDGWSVFVTSSVKPSSGEMKTIIECSGGKYLLKAPPTRWPPNSLVISCPADERDWAGLARRGKTPPIVSTEALFSGILRQNLNLEGYRLQ